MIIGAIIGAIWFLMYSFSLYKGSLIYILNNEIILSFSFHIPRSFFVIYFYFYFSIFFSPKKRGVLFVVNSNSIITFSTRLFDEQKRK